MSREAVFVDSGAWIALLSQGDQHHQRTFEVLQELRLQRRPLITTQAIVLEVGDGLAVRRRQFSRAFQTLLAAPYVETLPLNSLWLARAWELFDKRPDKEWSLTDFFSFTIMREYDLSDAFAHDHHFQQAGFTVLLR